MVFSVIIVNYNTVNLTRNCLNSLLEYSNLHNLEFIVVDNASSDDSFAVLNKEFGARIKLIKNSINIGFGAANNLGAFEAKGDILLLLNSDTLLKMDIFSVLEKTFVNEKIGIASPILLLANGQQQPHASGKIPSLKTLLFERGKISFLNDNLDWVSGAALAIRRSVFEKITGFDESFFMYFEDIDLCKRVKSLGYEVVLCPEAFLTHFGGASLGSGDEVRKKYYYQSQDYFYAKYYGFISRNIVKALRFFYRFFK
jgi:GT2 family glycosyltransferase